MIFSNNTILELIEALNITTHDEVKRFGLKFNIADEITGDYVKSKKTSIAQYLISNPEAIGPYGSNLAIEIFEHALKKYGSDINYFSESNSELMYSLDRDGFELKTNGLRRKIPAEIPIIEQENQLILLLDKYGFATAKGHYELAIAAHSRGEWAAANAMLRTFVEEFFNMVQTIICPGEYKTSNDRKIALAKAGFFIEDYNEYLFNGTGFVEGFWKRLHPEGSHPGLSEHIDSTFRLHLVILVIHYFIERLESKYGDTIPCDET